MRFSARRLLILPVFVTMLLIPQASAETNLQNLSLGSPSWSIAMREGLVKTGSSGSALPPEAGLSSMAFSGIRPGTWMVSPNWCTLNFLFNSTGTLSGGPYFIGTAKHCVQERRPADIAAGSLGDYDNDETLIGKHVSAVISSTPGDRPKVVDIGTVAYVTTGATVGNDFALIAIDSSLSHLVSPSIAQIGGPTSVYGGSGLEPSLLVGHGAALGTGGTTRAGAISSYNPSNPTGFGMLIPASPGDSGGPVRTLSGAAVGNVTHIGRSDPFPLAVAYGTRVTMVQSRWNLKVVTCSSAQPWIHSGCPS